MKGLTNNVSKTVVPLLLAVTPFFANAETNTKAQLLNNEFVEVIRLAYPPGTESGMHSHEYPNRVVYVEKGGLLELVPANPKETIKAIPLKSGTALFLPATTHNVRNIGDTTIILVETEIKQQN